MSMTEEDIKRFEETRVKLMEDADRYRNMLKSAGKPTQLAQAMSKMQDVLNYNLNKFNLAVARNRLLLKKSYFEGINKNSKDIAQLKEAKDSLIEIDKVMLDIDKEEERIDFVQSSKVSNNAQS